MSAVKVMDRISFWTI